ncbi:GTPase activating Rap/RanGAP domain-like 1, partial [Phlyctochytrium arcticum]
ETIKLAVIYVAPGQEDEQSIFQNSSGSIEYEEFIASLGWEVCLSSSSSRTTLVLIPCQIDLATHPGFLGGLERSLANGRVATYHCTATMEMLFHDVTKMPNDHNDPKQLKKKRHIGNDHVHIVWNEHYREYRRSTIGGDFGNAQIVITPRPDGLFAVSVLRDPKVPSFGPLHHQMIVSKKVLGPVVRQTASNAYRAALAMGDPTQKRHLAGVPLNRHAFAARREDIKTIAERHKVAKWTFERFVESVFATGAEGMVEQKEVVHPPGIGLSAGNGATTAAVTSPGQYRRNVSGTPA